jgi:diamine N-acetyltransferase
MVTLREVTADNVRAVCRLEVKPGQEQFVAPAAVSVAQSHYDPTSWLRAIYAGDELVGLVLLAVDDETGSWYLWRFEIAGEHQGKGYGRAAMELVIEHVRSFPDPTELLLSYEPGTGGPRDFYRRLGFEDTDRWEEGERVMRLTL